MMMVVLLIVSCHKTMDNDKPSVEIISPSANASFSILDTIVVHVKVQDDQQVKNVDIRLVDENLNYADHTISRVINKSEEEFSVGYVLQNISLLSGQYYLEIKVSDGTLITKAYVFIGIIELPLEWKGLIVISESGEVSKLGVDGTINPLWNFGNNIAVGAVNDVDSQIFIGNDLGSFFSVNSISSGAIAWQSDPLGSPQDGFFKDMFFSKGSRRLMVTSKENELRQFTADGVELTSIDFGGTYDLGEVLSVEDKIFLEVGSSFSTLSELRIYYAETGGLTHVVEFDGDAVEIIELNNDEVITLVNESDGSSVIMRYSRSLETVDFYPQFTESALSLTYLSGARVAIGLQGALYVYDFATNDLDLVMSDVSFSHMKYERVGHTLYAVEDNKVKLLNVTNWEEIGEVVINADVVDVFTLYNR